MDAPETSVGSVDKGNGSASPNLSATSGLSPDALDCLRQLASIYVWWKTPEEAIQFPSRIAAQVMTLGTWEDLNKLARAIGDDFLRSTLEHAEAGQFDARSWHYWHYRLGLAEFGKRPVPSLPVRKTA